MGCEHFPESKVPYMAHRHHKTEPCREAKAEWAKYNRKRRQAQAKRSRPE